MAKQLFYPSTSWANVVVFNSNTTTVTMDNINYMNLFANVQAANGTVILPSNVAPSVAFSVRKIDSSNNALTVITDSANCLIDGLVSVATYSVFDVLSFVMGIDGNYYTTSSGALGNANNANYLSGIVGFQYVTNAQLQANLAGISGANLTNYPNTAQLAANLANYLLISAFTANMAYYPNTSQFSSNLANYLTIAAFNSSIAYYPNTAQLASNLANYPNNSQLSSNLALYTTTALLTANYPNNSQLTSNLALYVNTAQLASNLAIYPNTAQLASNLANYLLITAFNSNIANYPNTAQLAANLANYPNTAQLSSNLALYTTTALLTANYPNNSQLASNLGNYATLTQLSSNLALYTTTALLTANYPNNSQLTANLANYPNTTQLSSNLANYPNTTQLASNLALYTTTALLTANYPNNSQLSSNLGNYQTTAGLNANIATYLPNYTGVLNALSISVGNSTVNVRANSSTLFISNATATVFSVNSTGVISGNGAGITSLNVATIIANSGIISNSSGLFVNVGAGLQFVSGALAVYPNNGLIANSSGLFLNPNTGITVNSTGIFAQTVTANSGIISNSSGIFANIGNGLSFSTGSIVVNSQSGLVSNSSGVFVIANSGLISNSTGVFVNPNTGLVANSLGVFVIAGNGVSIGSNVYIAATNGFISNSTGLFHQTNSGILANTSGMFANLAATPGLQFVSGGLAVLAGNGFTTNSTGVQLVVGNGHSVNSAGIQLTTGNGVAVNSTGIQLTTGNAVSINSAGIQISTGNGLATNTSGLQLIANSGTVVNSSGIFAGGTYMLSLDSIASSFNGSTTTFNLTYGGVAVSPTNAQSLLVSIDGIIQQPITVYTISGSQITFTTAPASGQQCFITYIGTYNSVYTAYSPNGQIYLLDSIASSFNGTTNTFNLTVGGGAVVPANPQNLIVTLGGVVQIPGSAYSVSGSSLTFSSPPNYNETCSIIMLGASTTTGVVGSNQQVIFNNSGVYAGVANLVWNTANSTLTANGTVVTNNINANGILSGAYIPAYPNPNLIRNGGMEIWQRGTSLTVNTTYYVSNSQGNVLSNACYTVDGWKVLPVGNSCTVTRSSGRLLSVYSMQINGNPSMTDLQAYQLIESIYAASVTNQTVTASAWIYNGTGSAIVPTLTVKNPTVLDNYASTTTVVSAVALQSCASGAWTQVGYTFNAGASCGLGISLSYDFAATLAAAANYVRMTECMLSLTPNAPTGLNANPPTFVPHHKTDLAFQKLYLTPVIQYMVAANTGGNYGGCVASIPLNMRLGANPTTVYVGNNGSAGTWTGGTNTSGLNINLSPNMAIIWPSNAQGVGYYTTILALFSSEI